LGCGRAFVGGFDDHALVVEGELQDGGVAAVGVGREEGGGFGFEEDLGLSDGGVGFHFYVAALGEGGLFLFLGGRFREGEAVGVGGTQGGGFRFWRLLWLSEHLQACTHGTGLEYLI
jgi:hypothetical protein